MKKFLQIIFLIFILCLQTALADEKITSVNYDTSANMLFLGSTSNVKLTNEIKVVKLSSPNRIYFDIPNTVLATGKQNYQVTSGGDLRQIVISQNSTNPNVVRVVIYFTENYKTTNLKIYRINNNIVVKFNNQVCFSADYMNSVYRDVKFEQTDYYAHTSMYSQEIITDIKPVAQQASTSSDKVLNQIQKAFDNSTMPTGIQTSYQNTNVKVNRLNFLLKSKYYLKSIGVKSNGILLSGNGNISFERAKTLGNPPRLILDMPNTTTSQSVRSKTYTYGLDTIRIGQFETNKSRLVISTDNPDKFLPISSMDNQSVLIVDKDKLVHDKLTNIQTNLTSTRFTKINAQNYGMNFYFSKPVLYSVKRDDTKITLYFFNAVQYNDQDFKANVISTPLSTSKIALMPRIGLRYSVLLDKDDIVKVYSGADARTIKLAITSTKKEELTQRTGEYYASLPTMKPQKSTSTTTSTEKLIKTRKSGEKVIVLDPGHGGTDCGATRVGIYEKDITTDVTQRVSAILKQKGYKVYMTRDEDKTVSLQERVDFAQNIDPDIFVSIHVNSSESTEPTGIETHYYHDYSIELARTVHESMASYLKTKNRGLLKSRFYVINHTTMPAILVEIGFISNEEERNELVSNKRKQATAKGIAEGIMNYYKQQQKIESKK